MNAIFKILSLAAILAFPALSFGQNNAQSGHPITIHIKYDKPVSGYVVSGEFYPFDADAETGQVTLRFRSLTGKQDFVYSNVGKSEDGYPEYPAKFTGYNLCKYLDKNAHFHDGDTLVFLYNTESDIFESSPLYYYAEFQFFDVDFDGVDEFLVNDFYRGHGGNNYTVYEITSNGLKKKSFEPFDRITNSIVFDARRRVIKDELHDGVFYSEYTEYQIASDGNSAKVISHKEVTHNQ